MLNSYSINGTPKVLDLPFTHSVLTCATFLFIFLLVHVLMSIGSLFLIHIPLNVICLLLVISIASCLTVIIPFVDSCVFMFTWLVQKGIVFSKIVHITFHLSKCYFSLI